MSDGPEGGYQPPQEVIRVAPASWHPAASPDFEGTRFLGKDKDSERMDDLLRRVKEGSVSHQEYLNQLPEFLFDGSMLTAEKKLVYREVLEKATLGALSLELGGNDKLRGIVDDITKAKVDDPDASLFEQVQERLLDLNDRPEVFTANGQGLTDDEVDKAKKGLKFARDDILIKAAKAAGIFRHKDPLTDQVRGINVQIKEAQEKYGFVEARDIIEGLKKDPSELRAVETRRLNRSSVDFGGMSINYINGAVDQMEMAFSLADAEQSEILMHAAEAAGQPVDVVAQFKAQSEAAKEDAEKREKRINALGWGKARPQLKQDAIDYIQGKGKYRKPEAAAGGVSGGDELLDALKKIVQFNEAQYKMAVEQNKALISGYESLASAIRQRAFTNPEQMDSSNPYWYRFDREGISDKERENYQGSIRFFLQLNYLSYIKELTGATGTKGWVEAQGARLQREYFRQAWENMPGFQTAVLTIAKDMFEDSSFFTQDNTGEGKEFDFKQFVLTEKGYKLLSDKKTMDGYRQKLTDALTERLKSDPAAIKWAVDHRLIDDNGQPKIRELVQTSVYAADELFFATGAYDSAHVYRSQIEDFYKDDPTTQAIFDKKMEVRILDKKITTIEKKKRDIEASKQRGDITEEEAQAQLEAEESNLETERLAKDAVQDELNAIPGYKRYTKVLQESHTISDAIRELYHPGLKLKERLSARKRYELTKAWIERNRGRAGAEDIVKEVLEEAEQGLAAERGFGGPLGAWIRENNSDPQRTTENGETFWEEFRTGKREYIPERMFYSILEMVDTGREEYVDPQTGLPSTSVADFLIDSRKTSQEIQVQVKKNGNLVFNDDGTPKMETIVLYDFTQDSKQDSTRVLDNIGSGEWWGSYWDIGSAAVALENHVMGGDPKYDRMQIDKFLDKWVKARGDKKLKPIFTDDAYVVAALALAISPDKGFETGRTDHRLELDPQLYQLMVNDILADDRIFMGKDLPSRAELLKTFKTGDATKLLDVLKDIFTSGTFLSSEYWKDRKSMARRVQILKDQQEELDRAQNQGTRRPRFSFT